MTDQHSDHELIRNTVARYTFTVDSKNWQDMYSIFTENARINFTFLGAAGEMQGVPALLGFIQKAAQDTLSQHAITTQSIQVTGSDTAEATTYMSVTHVGGSNHPQKGKMHCAWGKVVDRLVKGPFDADGKVGWRIQERVLYEQLPSTGELNLLGKAQ